MKTLINLLVIVLSLITSISCNGMVLPQSIYDKISSGQENRKTQNTCIEILGVTGEPCLSQPEIKLSETSIARPDRRIELSEEDLIEIRTLAKMSDKELLSEIRFLLPELSHEEQRNYATKIKEIAESQPLKAQSLVDRSTSLQETCIEYAELTGEYVYKAGCQVIMGNYTDETSLLGTIGEVGLGLAGLDFAADIRDLSHDLLNAECTWSWAGKTTLDGIGLIPVAGAIKYAGKVSDLVKGVSKSSKVLDAGRKALKHSNSAVNVAQTAAKNSRKSIEIAQKAVKNGEEVLQTTGKKISKGSKNTIEAATDRPFRYRGDSRSADEIFKDGFKPRGTSEDLLLHAKDNMSPPSAYVSTSKNRGVAYGFNDNVYVVRPKGGIDVNKALGEDSPFYDEFEVAVRGAIAPEDVRALTLPDKGLSILNPNYRP
jgi:hypothetical protein